MTVSDNAPLFSDLGLDDRVLAALRDVGYETPSPIQAEAIPPLLSGRHVVGLAQTGTGKTAAFALPALTITELYRLRWQVELFFKWIKQHLRIKVFFGTSENAVKTQIWIAVSVYVLIAIVKKRLNLSASLYELLQILSLTLFERISLIQLLADSNSATDLLKVHKQLNLFN